MLPEKWFIVADNVHGIYQFQHFAKWAKDNLDETRTLPLGNLLKGPDDEYYIEAWEEIEQMGILYDQEKYNLCFGPCNDLFMVKIEFVEEFYEGIEK